MNCAPLNEALSQSMLVSTTLARDSPDMTICDPTPLTQVTQQKITNKHGEVKQIITITKRPDARPINHKRITMKDLFPKELSRC